MMRKLATLCCLVAALAACNDSTTSTPATSSAGMKKYKYLNAAGGPHLLLPTALAADWKGAPDTKTSSTGPKSDFQRACLATALEDIALLKVGTGEVLVFCDPATSAWGKSSDGNLEIYVLKSFDNPNLDNLIDRARNDIDEMKETSKFFVMTGSDAILMFAGDTLNNATYATQQVPLAQGSYKVLQGKYQAGNEIVIVYRLVPGTPPTTSTSEPATASAPAK